jgi:hypothetical protein
MDISYLVQVKRRLLRKRQRREHLLLFLLPIAPARHEERPLDHLLLRRALRPAPDERNRHRRHRERRPSYIHRAQIDAVRSVPCAARRARRLASEHEPPALPLAHARGHGDRERLVRGGRAPGGELGRLRGGGPFRGGGGSAAAVRDPGEVEVLRAGVGLGAEVVGDLGCDGDGAVGPGLDWGWAEEGDVEEHGDAVRRSRQEVRQKNGKRSICMLDRNVIRSDCTTSLLHEVYRASTSDLRRTHSHFMFLINPREISF